LEGPEPAYHQVVSGYEIYKHQNGPFQLKYNNKSLNEFQLAYETWGKLNAKKNNAILIFTGLSASSHAKSHEVCDRILFFLSTICEYIFSKIQDLVGGNNLSDLI
jgi:homoserine O-acetyltransferase